MTNRIREVHMDPSKAEAVQQAMPHGIVEYGAQTSEVVQPAIDRLQTSDRRKAHMRGEK